MADYKETIFLPKTSFALKSDPQAREEKILKQWHDKQIYKNLRIKRKDQEKFILHVGPPYANGHIHVGHALNYILKDTVVRLHQLQGKDTPTVPGWDCHGLPIEWKIEEAYRAKGQSKDTVSIQEFRAECRAFAQQWIDIQSKEFQRLGLLWDFENPYITMDYQAEADTVAKFFEFLNNDSLYKGIRPVLWSVVEKTALAEAEVEYEDKTSTYVYVRFPMKQTSHPNLENTSIVIWTTTPWTLPGNRAVSYGPDIAYGVYQVNACTEDSLAQIGEKLLIAEALIDTFASAVGITDFKKVANLKGSALAETLLHHPLYTQGFDFEVPLIGGNHVTVEAGTGLVHTAPGHGIEDFAVCKQHQIVVPETVAEDGTYYPHVPIFANQHIFKIDKPMIEALHQAGMLVKSDKMVHSYPHSWRSKAPLIYRTTPQWFISMEKTQLRQKALEAIKGVKWYPAQGENRIRGMVETRPDWCISRQRAWGVPLALFVDKRTGQPLKDDRVNQRILKAIEQEGADAWFSSPPERFLEPEHNKENFEQVRDILDVWFDSGATHHFVLEKRPDLEFPASLYLEGSDQHRGWFQSSLLVSCGTRAQAPYKAVLTHGFVMDEQGRKMSKSLGNVVAPEKVIETLGAEILRLWVVNCDYTDDLRLGSSILKHQEDIYRRYRNTLRYLLGALADFDPTERLERAEMPYLEQWILHRLSELNQSFIKLTENYELQNFYTALHTFCASDLSAFYFDIRKDVLYCDAPSSLTRRAVRTVLDLVFQQLVHWLSPVLCFTAEEAWQERMKNYLNPEEEIPSLAFSTLPTLPDHIFNSDLAQHIDDVRHQRRLMTGALEQARTQGMIGSSLQAELVIYDPQGILAPSAEWEELAIVSKLTFATHPIPANAYRLPEVPGLAVVVRCAPGVKCERCWKVLEEVEQSVSKVCGRCEKALKETKR